MKTIDAMPNSNNDNRFIIVISLLFVLIFVVFCPPLFGETKNEEVVNKCISNSVGWNDCIARAKKVNVIAQKYKEKGKSSVFDNSISNARSIVALNNMLFSGNSYPTSSFDLNTPNAFQAITTFDTDVLKSENKVLWNKDLNLDPQPFHVLIIKF